MTASFLIAGKSMDHSHKAVGFTCTLKVSPTCDETIGLYDQIKAMTLKDPVVPIFEISLQGAELE